MNADVSRRGLPVSSAAIRTILKSQYHAALAMLHESIERCPAALWNSEQYRNRCWQVAYHALYFAHLYLGQDEASFRPWEHHQEDSQYPDAIPGPNDPASALPVCPETYTQAEVLSYALLCDEMVDAAVDAMDLNRSECGFSWYPIPKLEHQFVNIRHIQHHAAQLADRVRSAANVGIDWVGARREEARSEETRSETP